MAKVLPHADLKADPHIKSKVKILKKQLSYVLEIMQNGSGFGWDDEMKMVVGDRDTYMGWAKVMLFSVNRESMLLSSIGCPCRSF
jgi:phosphoribosylanthranilate isomerase